MGRFNKFQLVNRNILENSRWKIKKERVNNEKL